MLTLLSLSLSSLPFWLYRLPLVSFPSSRRLSGLLPLVSSLSSFALLLSSTADITGTAYRLPQSEGGSREEYRAVVVVVTS